ncbi:hypothetical protein DMENIID0001_121890 [Sergentomyia squamirostris]
MHPPHPVRVACTEIYGIKVETGILFPPPSICWKIVQFFGHRELQSTLVGSCHCKRIVSSALQAKLYNILQKRENEEYVNIGGDVMLLELCERFGVEEAYAHLIAVGITYSPLKDLTDEDINDILPKGAIRVIFRRGWKKLCLPEEPPDARNRGALQNRRKR